ncbi:MAG TPA: acyl-CoA thioester hydrolase/BAAT C-terminal domain-containing protein [Kofleriaceae bacterium]|jgi:dienelactone hydrolase
MTIRFARVAPDGESCETDVRYPGDAIAVRVDDLVPHATYTVRLARWFRDAPFASVAEVTADGDGAIDTRADPDRLFWSMRREPGETARDRFDGFVLAVERDGTVLATRALAARSLHPNVRAHELDRRDGLVGTLFVPDAGGPRPGILVLGGSGGGLDAAGDYAAALANRGFVALALAYFAAPGLPPTLAGIPIEYFARAVRALGDHPAVARDHVAVVGRSRGGELALLLGSIFPDLAAVVSHVGSAHRWCGTDGPASAAWTRGGIALPHLSPSGPPDVERTADGELVFAMTPAFVAALDAADPVLADAAMSEIEATRGPILLSSGADDQVWPSARLAEAAFARLAGRNRGDEWIAYDAAGHGATLLPGDPTTDPTFPHPLIGVCLKYGGTAEGNAKAQRAAWNHVVRFLRRALET